MKKWLLVSLLSFHSFAVTSYKNHPADLVKKSDFYRGDFSKGFSWPVTLLSVDDGEEIERRFNVFSKGNNSKAVALFPERNVGEVYLFNDRVMWFFRPSLKKPMSLSTRQRLQGQTANGDIATTHYARDYDAVYEKDDTYNGTPIAILLLTSKDKKTTYDKIRYYVSLVNLKAVKADFLGIQGNLLKTATFFYENKIQIEGKDELIVSKMIIEDGLNKQNKSTIIYGQPKIESLSDAQFNVANLTK